MITKSQQAKIDYIKNNVVKYIGSYSDSEIKDFYVEENISYVAVYVTVYSEIMDKTQNVRLYIGTKGGITYPVIRMKNNGKIELSIRKFTDTTTLFDVYYEQKRYEL